MFLLMWTSLRRFFENISFSHSERLLCQKINNAQALPLIIDEHIHNHFHPLEHGFAHTGSLSETYASAFYALQSANQAQRKQAVLLLVRQWNDAPGIALPMNKARLRLYLIKKILQTKSNFQQQLSYLRYFQQTVSCSDGKIRRFLHDFGLAEIQENPHSNITPYVFDNYIINNTNLRGRTLSVLLADLFIQGINEATLVSPTILSKEEMEEAYETAALFKIRLRMGVPFDTYQDGYQAKCLAVLPYFSSGHALLKFYTKHQVVFARFNENLEKAQVERIKLLQKGIKEFNRYHLESCNEHYSESQKPYFLEPLKLEEIFAEYEKKIPTEMHLAVHLYKKYKRVLLNRILLIKEIRKNPQAFDASWDIEVKKNELQNIKTLWNNLSPYRILKQYFMETLGEASIPSIFHLNEITSMFRSFGGQICLLSPLKLDEKSCEFFLHKNGNLFDRIEVYNGFDAVNKSLSEMLSFMKIVQRYRTQDRMPATLEMTCGSHALAMEESMGIGIFIQKPHQKMPSSTPIPAQILDLILEDQQANALLSFPVATQINRPLPEEITQNRTKPLISGVLHLFSYLNPVFSRIGLSLAALFIANFSAPLGITMFVFVVIGAYIGLLRTQLIEQPCVEEEQATFSLIPKILFILALLIPLQAKIFNLFYLDWMYFVPPFLLLLCQLFALSVVNLALLLTLSFLYKNLGQTLKNPIYCTMLAWPITSILMLLLKMSQFPPALLMFAVTATLGIISSLLGYLKFTKQQNKKILSHLLDDFTHYQNDKDMQIPSLLNLLYFVPRYLGITEYWKKVLRSKKLQDETKQLLEQSTILKTYVGNDAHYSETLAWITEHYPAGSMSEIVGKTLGNWKKLKRILLPIEKKDPL